MLEPSLITCSSGPVSLSLYTHTLESLELEIDKCHGSLDRSGRANDPINFSLVQTIWQL